MEHEFPEQCMAMEFFTGNEKVLEIGGNIGRNSIMIASILNDPANLVVLESSKPIADILTCNKELNHLNFHIENSALSKRKLIQKAWTTIPSDVVLDGYSEVRTVSFSELKQKYNVDFERWDAKYDSEMKIWQDILAGRAK